MLEEAFELFVRAAPATVMIRGVLENILSAHRLDAIFADSARSQYTRDIAFSSVVRLMSQVVMRMRPAVYAAYRAQKQELKVTHKALYNKLDGIEPTVSRELVRRTAREMGLVIQTMGAEFPSLLPGYRTRILDGNHLAGTDRRLKVLRGQSGAALPGHSLAVLDPALKLIVDIFPCEDAYTQERALLCEVLEIVEAGDLWIDDRNFCTIAFLCGTARKGAAFLAREHASLPWKPASEWVDVGEIDTGYVFEQMVQLVDANGEESLVRRVTIELNQPTRDGDRVLHLLTNIPVEHANALVIASLYSQRWQIETAFHELTVDLCCEVSTLSYPKAALFAFAVAVMCYNAFSVTKAALRSAKSSDPAAAPSRVPSGESPQKPQTKTPPSSKDDLSTYYLADEIAGNWRGMAVVLPEPFWKEKFADLTAAELANELQHLARRTDISRYRKRAPSAKRSVQKAPCRPGSHVSTARELKKP